jgi:hypothetical protein
MQKIIFLGLAFMVAVMVMTLPANADRGRHAAKHSGHGGYRGYSGHGGYSDHRGGHIGIGVYLGPGWWGPAWRGPYPYYDYYPYYPYPYYPVPIVVEQPSTEIFVQQATPAGESSYWYYCRESQGYYPDVDKCPGGWLKVVPPDSPPQ